MIILLFRIELEKEKILSEIDSNLSKGKAGIFDIRPVADSILPDKTATISVRIFLCVDKLKSIFHEIITFIFENRFHLSHVKKLFSKTPLY